MSINAWGSDDPAEVAKGGTGNATLTDHGVLLGSGTAAVTPTAALTNGQLLIGSTGADPSLAAPTGDTNEIAITAGAGTLAVGIADDPVIPGNASITIPVGTTAQEPSAADGKMRYDSDTEKLRASINGTWVDLATGTAGALNYITSTTATTAASVVFTNTTLATYQHFLFVYEMHPVSSGPTLLVELSNNNGSSYHTSGYVGVSTSSRAGVGTVFCVAPTTTLATDPSLAYNNGSTFKPAGHGYFWLMNPLDSAKKTFCEAPSSLVYNTDPFNWVCNSMSYYDTAEANNAIRFIFSSGNIDTGKVEVWGLLAS